MKNATLLGVALLVAGAGMAGAQDADVALEFPADYRSFENYFTGDRQNGTQIISIYANDVAVSGARSDGKLPYGSVLVAELTPAEVDENDEPLESSLGHLISTGEIAAIVVMERLEGTDARIDDGLEVGDWEFEVFSAAGENLAKETEACRGCHAPLTDSEYLFSYEHLTHKLLE